MRNESVKQVNVYKSCLIELKFRLEAIKNKRETDFSYKVFYLEFICLQYRKICELFAFATLIANKDEYSKVRSQYERDWNFNGILKTVKKINPMYFPEPLKLQSIENKTLDYKGITNDFFSENDLVSIYDACCDIVHAQNHYKDLDEFYLIKSREILGEYMDWYERIKRLLSCHVIGVNTRTNRNLLIGHLYNPKKPGSVLVISAGNVNKTDIYKNLSKNGKKR